MKKTSANEIQGIIKRAWKYTNRAAAFRVANQNHRLAVVLGDDDRFWVVTVAEAQKLERAGYTWETK